MSAASPPTSFFFSLQPQPKHNSAVSDADSLLLPPWQTSLSSIADKELSVNAPISTPERPRSVLSQSMDAGTYSLSSQTFLAKHNNSLPTREFHDLFGDDRSLMMRSRNIHGNNSLHQRAYYTEPTSPLFHDFNTLAPEPKDKDSTTLVSNHPSHPKQRILLRTHSNHSRQIMFGVLRRIRSLTDTPSFWLALYFTFNLTLTLYNKAVLIHFPFPYTLTALHALCGTIGTFVLIRLDHRRGIALTGAQLLSTSVSHHNALPSLSGRELLVLFLFSILYTVNIVVSNASLRLVTVPFHQVVRASAPFFTIMFAAFFLRKGCSVMKLLSLIPVVAGVGFATYGDYYFTMFGFALTLLGTLLAAMKTVVTNVLLVKPVAVSLPITSDEKSQDTRSYESHSTFSLGSFSSAVSIAINRFFPPSPSSSPTYMVKALPTTPVLSSSFSVPKLCLSPIHLLYLLSPLAFVQTTLMAHFTGELDSVRWHQFTAATDPTFMGKNWRLWILLNGVLAFFLNVVSFNANRRVGPLAMSVAANVKQVLTIICAVVIFDLTITPANGIGIILTLIGGGLYAMVELREKQDKKHRIG